MSRNTVNCLLVVVVFVLLCQVALLVSKLSKASDFEREY